MNAQTPEDLPSGVCCYLFEKLNEKCVEWWGRVVPSVINRPQRVWSECALSRYRGSTKKLLGKHEEATEEDEAYRVIYFGNDLYYSQRSPKPRIRINKCK